MKVAVVGSGVSGLAATWLLNEHSDHVVHLYEADPRPGGHANTVVFTPPGSSKGDSVDVDTGFIVFNPTTYPNFLRFLRMHPSTRNCIVPTEMTFSVSRDGGRFEWAGKDLRTVFCQPKNLLEPSMWRLLWDVTRFNACAGRFLNGRTVRDISIGEYLDREGYSASFRDNYLIPMTAAIWSTPPDKCAMDFPARTLIQFMHNHHLLQTTGKPSWLTLKGGSKIYVDQILSKLPKSQLHLSTPVQSITTVDTSPKIALKTKDGNVERFDYVILACHSDEALRIIKAGRPDSKKSDPVYEKQVRILSSFDWNRNEAVLHSDIALMPKSRLAWSCWNYLTHSVMDEKGITKANDDEISLTYGMNDLQHIPESRFGPVLVTLNPPKHMQPREELIQGRWKYDHPIIDEKAVSAQKEMNDIQGKRSISYAGAYLRYGFHEDGFTSGLIAAAALCSTENGDEFNVRPPFPFIIEDVDVRRTWFTGLAALLFDVVEASGIRALMGYLGGALLHALVWTANVASLTFGTAFS